jgi:hypothetical protein
LRVRAFGGYASWLRAVEHALEAPSSHWPPDAVEHRPFADLEASFWSTATVLRFYAPALAI